MQLINPKTNKMLIFILMGLIAVSLIYLRIQSQLTQPPPPEVVEDINKPTLSTYQTAQNQTTSFSGQKIPESLDLFTQTAVNTTLEEAIKTIDALGYQNPTIQPNAVIVEDQEKKVTILINLKTNTVIYDQPYNFNLNSSDETFVNIAKTKLSQFVNFEEDVVWQNAHSFVQRGAEEDGHQGAIMVHFFPTINGLRVVSGQRTPVGDVGIAKVTFHPESKHLTLNIEQVRFSTTTPIRVKLKSLTTVEADISSGKSITTAIYPNTNQVGKYYESPFVPKNADFNLFEIVYFYEIGKTGYLKPLILASGKAQLTTGEQASIKTLLPVVEE